MKDFFRTLTSVIFWVITILLFFMVASGLYQHFFGQDKHTGFFGIGYAVVVSGSMEPNIHVNDMIIYQKHDQADYRINNVIVYERQNEDEAEPILITHRIKSIDGDTLITRGDANSLDDQPITFSRVVGRLVWRIPKVGALAGFVKTTLGVITVIALVVIMLIINIALSREHKRDTIDTSMGEQTLKF